MIRFAWACDLTFLLIVRINLTIYPGKSHHGKGTIDGLFRQGLPYRGLSESRSACLLDSYPRLLTPPWIGRRDVQAARYGVRVIFRVTAWGTA
jgi:hypothetical protein